MRKVKAKEIRKVLNLPRVPKDMNEPDRKFYRKVKKIYKSKSADEQKAYLDNASMVRKMVLEQIERERQSFSQTGSRSRPIINVTP